MWSIWSQRSTQLHVLFLSCSIGQQHLSSALRIVSRNFSVLPSPADGFPRRSQRETLCVVVAPISEGWSTGSLNVHMSLLFSRLVTVR